MNEMNALEMVASGKPAQPPGLGVWLASLGDALETEKEGLCPDGIELSPIAVVGSGRSPTLRVFGELDRALPAYAQNALCAVIFDGLLYNQAELRNHFKGSLLHTANEAELVLQAYLRWGEDALPKIRGLFALVIWDGQQERLLCVRDRLGNHPLFYADTGRAWLISTSLEVLAHHPRVSAGINRVVVVEHLLNRLHKAEETLFTHIKRIPPGHVMRVSNGSHQMYRYWDPAPPGAQVNWLREDELELFDDLFTQTVKRYLELGPAAIYLSGGLDSVSVAAAALDSDCRVGQPPPWALSLVFPHPEANEEVVQKSVAQQLGLPQLLVPFEEAIGSQGLLLADLEMSARLPMPLLNPWLPAYRYLGLAGKNRGCQVILTGGGGDEWLGVSPYLVADLMLALDVVGLYRFWRTNRRSYRLPLLPASRFLLWTCGVRPLLYNSIVFSGLRRVVPKLLRDWRRQRQRTRLTPAWIAPGTALWREIDERVEQTTQRPQFPKEGFYLHELRPAIEHPVMSWELEEMFENGRQMGLRVFQPYWDAEMVELLCRTPPHLLNKGGRSKGLVRQSLERRFPHLGFERQKKVSALNFFTSSVLKESTCAWQMMGGAPTLAELGVVDAKILSANIEQILANNQTRQAHRIWDILVLEAWLRTRL